MTSTTLQHISRTRKALAVLLVLTLTACAQPGMNRYGYQDVGRATEVYFGTLISSRPVEITGHNSGVGALAGASAGAVAGAGVGNGTGQLGAMIAGALIAGIAGHMTEQAISDHQGIECVVTLENGQTVTIVQNTGSDEKPLRKGSRVMVQGSGMYARVLPADDLPTKIKRPKRIKVED